jgi:hypothetical protein
MQGVHLTSLARDLHEPCYIQSLDPGVLKMDPQTKMNCQQGNEDTSNPCMAVV